MLVLLSSHVERVFTYQKIYEAVWEEPYTCEKGNSMTHIRHLREKIEPDPSHPKYIENVRGIGYRFAK
ncbi:MAG TPA: helix-turn-helix domain-containing protein [Candidatus Mediterraneibacter stercoripullorum]|nr:helix-turn-helix domain-containing protein [Candidatus Mediterraneibacter stercoripullorum]